MPQNIPAIDIASITDVMSPFEDAHAPPIRLAVITVIGPVGPLIWLCVPPKRAAKNPSIVAPVKPVRAPKELASGESTPPKACIPKANASGRATMPAVIPPKTSPLMFVIEKCLMNCFLFAVQIY